MSLGSLLFGSPGSSKSSMIREITKPPLTNDTMIRDFKAMFRAMFMQDSEKFERLPDGFDVLDYGVFDMVLRKLEQEVCLQVGKVNPTCQYPKLTSTRRTDQPTGSQTQHPLLTQVPALISFNTYDTPYRAVKQRNTIFQKHSFSQNASRGDQAMLYLGF